jgi:CubicO group peptidase (beta-lactamase class C family)
VLLIVAFAAACGSPDDGASTDRPNVDSASEPSSQWQALEDFLREQAATGAFSGAVLVAKDGQPTLEEAYGLANREANEANNTDTRFNIGSVGKMFTAVAIAQLVEEGKLAFDDTIGEHLTGLPADIAALTVDQLLTHTSGLGDFMRNGYPKEAKAARTAAELLPLVINQPLEFKPGTRESYSNSGYVVLGAIIEVIIGQSYYDYVREHIFQPAGMTRTGWFPPGQDTDNTAIGYMAGGGAPATVTQRPSGSNNASDDKAGAPGSLTDNSNVVPWGNPSGGAYATVGDLQRFAEALLANKLLSAEMTTTVLSGKVSMSNGAAEVAYGFTDGTVNGVRIVGHSGGAQGVAAAVDIYPDLGYVVVILANYDGVVDPVRDKIMEILTA